MAAVSALQASAGTSVARPRSSICLPARICARRSLIVAHAKNHSSPAQLKDGLVAATAFSAMSGSFLAAGNAQAAQEVANLAAGDNRVGALSLLLVPALGWVLFNIGSPALNQLSNMGGGAKRGIAAGLGLGAAGLLLASRADAAAEVAQLAAGDNRFGAIAFVFIPVVGWVLFNIGGPALNQLSNMGAKAPGPIKKLTKKRSVAIGLGLGAGAAASLLLADHAEAATEIMQLAAGDNRLGVLTTLLIPVLGWVGFNIAQPALNQLDNMGAPTPKGGKRR